MCFAGRTYRRRIVWSDHIIYVIHFTQPLQTFHFSANISRSLLRNADGRHRSIKHRLRFFLSLWTVFFRVVVAAHNITLRISICAGRGRAEGEFIFQCLLNQLSGFFPGTYTVNVFVLQPCFESLSFFLFLISNRAPLDAIRGGVSGEKFNRNPYAAVSDVEVNVFFSQWYFFCAFPTCSLSISRAAVVRQKLFLSKAFQLLNCFSQRARCDASITIRIAVARISVQQVWTRRLQIMASAKKIEKNSRSASSCSLVIYSPLG